ncbi:hypothetical protein ACFRDV_16540 [Streptomyces fagopyri]|uniref:hypothetical protein n=1 Tax=Streptomyces fagopyri TaxID=2662397 RepID=UPI0036C0151E
MQHRTDPAAVTEATAEPGNWCHWHRGPSNTSVVVDVADTASGPGKALYACAPCRQQRGLTPYSRG